MAIAAYIPILCPQKQIAICSLTENIPLCFLTAERRGYNSDCWNNIVSATSKTFAQHILSQKLQCLQSCAIFKKQSNCQWSSHCSRYQLQPTHTARAQQPHGTYLENLSARADDLFLLTRESSFAVIFKDCEVHCLLLNGEGSIFSPEIPAQKKVQCQAI